MTNPEKHIYIIRHGETDYNKSGYLQGATINSSLNARGKKQAQAFFEHYKSIPFNRIYTSKLKRSIESVDEFARLGIPVEHHLELNEINWGKFEGKKLSFFSTIRINNIIHNWRKGKTDLRIPGGESPIDLAEKQKKVIDLIFSRKDENNVLVSMHGRAMRIFLCQLMQLSLINMDHYKHDNLALYHLCFPNDNAQPILIANNDIIHLKEIKY
jgi:2,3-bisphosphoglycerate-dependent phosphoglycerate mutase